MQYKWAQGTRSKGLSAEVAGTTLESIRVACDGKLVPSAVVAWAEPETSPIHNWFEWDDGEAATLYREQQAREIIRSVVVVVEDKGKTHEPVRAFVHVLHPGDDQAAYTSIETAMSDDDLREQVIGRAMKELTAWRKRYAQYRELAAVFDAMDSISV